MCSNYTTTRENWELRHAPHRCRYRPYYTTTRENWELRPTRRCKYQLQYYTTTKENWELRLFKKAHGVLCDYTTTKENWELRRVSLSSTKHYDYTTIRRPSELNDRGLRKIRRFCGALSLRGTGRFVLFVAAKSTKNRFKTAGLSCDKVVEPRTPPTKVVGQTRRPGKSAGNRCVPRATAPGCRRTRREAAPTERVK